MKILYIEARQNTPNLQLSKSEIKKLPKKLFLAYTIQYKGLAFSIKTQLEKSKIKIEKIQQVLGCSKINTDSPILLVSTGEFHSLNLFSQSPKIYILKDNKISQIPDSEIKKARIQRRTALIKFLNADKIGILVSTKPGQENLKLAEKLKSHLNSKGKQAYIFLSNNIDISQFENFNIQSWVNTSCLGLINDNSNIINYSELPRL